MLLQEIWQQLAALQIALGRTPAPFEQALSGAHQLAHSGDVESDCQPLDAIAADVASKHATEDDSLSAGEFLTKESLL